MCESLKSVEVDLPERQEIRLVLPCNKTNEILDILADNGLEEMSFSDRKTVRTVYLNNEEHEVPWGVSLKARQYTNEILQENELIDPDEQYFLEIKTSNSDHKEKRRLEISLTDACAYLNNDPNLGRYIFSSPIKPHLIDEYKRLHFVSRDSEISGLRVTCDFSPKYFLIDSGGKLVFLRQENTVRVEIKTKEDSILAIKLASEIENIGARKVISKKQTSYWAESLHRKSSAFKLTKEFKETEIESKLLVTDPDPSLFFNKFVLFMRERRGNFMIAPSYQNVEESGSMNSYFLDGEHTDLDNDGIKILARPDVAKVILKSETIVLPDKYGFGSILKRKEVKRRYFPLEEGNLEAAIKSEQINAGITGSPKLVGEIERLRKGIWLLNMETKRCYHVTIDQCQVGTNKFHEIEVEYTGTGGMVLENPINEVVDDISELTKLIIDTFPGSAVPCKLTKLNWLKEKSK